MDEHYNIEWFYREIYRIFRGTEQEDNFANQGTGFVIENLHLQYRDGWYSLEIISRHFAIMIFMMIWKELLNKLIVIAAFEQQHC